jgi:hypothetical protein
MKEHDVVILTRNVTYLGSIGPMKIPAGTHVTIIAGPNGLGHCIVESIEGYVFDVTTNDLKTKE